MTADGQVRVVYRPMPFLGGSSTTRGADAGITGGDFSDCVEDLQYDRWTQRATDAASKAGVVQTPTVRVDGEQLADSTPEGLRQAVSAAGA